MVLVVAAAAIVFARLGLGFANAIGGKDSVYRWFTGAANPYSSEIVANVGAPSYPFATPKVHV
jgi:hypothetical protein